MALTAQQTITYLQKNPDVAEHAAAKGIDPAAFAAAHFQRHGAQEIASGQRTNPFEQEQQAMAPSQSGLRSALESLDRAETTARGDISGGRDQALGFLEQYRDAGGKAFGVQAALSGALGSDAQRQAYTDFNESPSQAYLREMGEKAVLRNAAATGGTQGGNVLKELQRQGVGLAAQDFDKYFNRLNQIGQAGLGTASQSANVAMGAGTGLANVSTGLGGQRANMQFQAGQNIANAIGAAGQNMGQLTAQQGAGIAGAMGQGGAGIADLLAGIGSANLGANQNLAQLLSGINMSQPNLSGVAGVQQTPGIIGGVGNALSGVGGFLGAL